MGYLRNACRNNFVRMILMRFQIKTQKLAARIKYVQRMRKRIDVHVLKRNIFVIPLAYVSDFVSKFSLIVKYFNVPLSVIEHKITSIVLNYFSAAADDGCIIRFQRDYFFYVDFLLRIFCIHVNIYYIFFPGCILLLLTTAHYHATDQKNEHDTSEERRVGQV